MRKDNHMKRALSVLTIVMMTGCLDTGDGSGSEEDLEETDQEVIYGNDDRTEVRDHSDANLRRLTEMSTATLINRSNINVNNPNNVTFPNVILKNSFGHNDDDPPNLFKSICQTPAPRFANDITVGYCTGTLIDDDLLLTAGHCMAPPQPSPPCGVNGTGLARFVFNYRNDEPSALHTILWGMLIPEPMVPTLRPAASGAIVVRTGAGVKRGVAGRSSLTMA
jgi:hypothetical protein